MLYERFPRQADRIATVPQHLRTIELITPRLYTMIAATMLLKSGKLVSAAQ
jgi:hypothetical protein